MLGQMLRPAFGATGLPHRCRVVTGGTHVLDGDDDRHLHLLAHAGVDDVDRTWRVGRGIAPEKACRLLERALRGRQADPLRRPIGDLLQAFERHRQVGAALGGGHRVDLVDDHRLDAFERLAGRAT